MASNPLRPRNFTTLRSHQKRPPSGRHYFSIWAHWRWKSLNLSRRVAFSCALVALISSYASILFSMHDVRFQANTSNDRLIDHYHPLRTNRKIQSAPSFRGQEVIRPVVLPAPLGFDLREESSGKTTDISNTLDHIENEHPRKIAENDTAIFQSYREEILQRMDARRVSPRYLYDDVDILQVDGCLQATLELANRQKYHPTCNEIHALTFDFDQSAYTRLDGATWHYISSGSYHDVWAVTRNPYAGVEENSSTVTTSWAVKRLRWLSADTATLADERLLFDTQKEIRLMTELPWNDAPHTSNKMMNLYAACATTLWTPLAHHSLVDEILPTGGRTTKMALHTYQQRHPNKPWLNGLSGSQKLDIALETATSLAALHRNGVLHGDVNPSQWLRMYYPSTFNEGKSNGLSNFGMGSRLVLNDLNAAEVLGWNSKLESFCPTPHAYRGLSPEEALYHPITASADVYALGFVWYSVVTGLQPFFDYNGKNDDYLPEKSAAGETPYISDAWFNLGEDHRIEMELLRMLPMCWEFDATKRPTAAELVRSLQRIKDGFDSSRDIATL